jgi:transposase-like protein
MKTAMPANFYKNHRFRAEIISHAVWLYFRFCLSDRDVEEQLFARGVTVTYEAIRKWCREFGPAYANQLHRRRPGPGDSIVNVNASPPRRAASPAPQCMKNF